MPADIETTKAELAIMEAIQADPLHKVEDQHDRHLLSGLYRRKLVTDIFTRPGRKLTPEGLHLLLAAKEAAQRAADKQAQREADEARKEAADRANADEYRKKQFQHDWRIAIFEALAGFLLGAVADHLFDIVGNTTRTVLAALAALGLLH